MGKELEMLKLLERGTGVPGSEAALAGTSMGREAAIRGAAKDLLAEAPAKTAEAPVDPHAPGSLSTFLEKNASGWARAALGFGGGLSKIPFGRMAAGSAAGGFTGSLLTDPDSEHEGRNMLLGAVGGAGLAHGLSKNILTPKGLRLQASQKANRLALKTENQRLLERNKMVNETQFNRGQEIDAAQHEVNMGELLKKKRDLSRPPKSQPTTRHYETTDPLDGNVYLTDYHE
jgi:hypothetical protein